MRSSLMTVLAGTALLVTLADAGAQTPQTYPGVTKFTRVDAVVACAGATEISALEQLKKDGFVAVINLRPASEPNANVEQSEARAKELGLKYIHIPFNGQAPEASAVDTFLARVADRSNQPVFIHCGTANRVGAMWLTKRVLQDGYTIEKATAEAKAIGLTSPVLEKFMLEYIAAHQK